MMAENTLQLYHHFKLQIGNMKVILFAAALCIFQVYSVTGYEGLMEVEPVDGKCVTPNGDSIAPGEEFYDNENCEKLSCSDRTESDGKFLIANTGCGSVGLSAKDAEKCHMEGGTGPYPDCCPYNIVCND